MLARLYYPGGVGGYRQNAARVIDAFLTGAIEAPLSFSGLLNAADTLLNAIQIVVIGDRADRATQALLNNGLAHESARANINDAERQRSARKGPPCLWKRKIGW